jgi:hypothetical protein
MTSSVSLSTTSDSSSIVKQSQISNSTKRQLEALGIDSSNVTSEAQAQSLITAKQAEKSFQDTMSMNAENQQEQSSDTTESSLISEAKTLASELGISVSSDATFDEITSEINDAIEKLMEKSANDPQAMQRAQSYMTQLAQLNSSYSSVSSSTNSLYSAMNYQASNTRYMLGL